MPFMLMDNAGEDPANVIIKKVGMKKDGVIPGFSLFGNRVLIGVYERPSKTKSGIHLPDQVRREDEHQGKSALVLMLGHAAFVSDDNFNFGPDKLEVGDWVLSFISVGIKCVINGQLCRIVRDQDLVMRIPAPDAVW